jgi:carbonic anhydrase/acetyltransferase-like protein (isoleucine patch superfamily)
MTKIYTGENTVIKGDTVFGEDCSVWHNAVIRADNAQVRIGVGTNIQDLAMLHTGEDAEAVTVGSYVTIGHCAIVHGCTVGDNTTIGMGAIIMNRAVIGRNCMIGAGSLVTQGKEFPDGSLIMGSPAKLIRPLCNEEIAALRLNSERYVVHAKKELKESDL